MIDILHPIPFSQSILLKSIQAKKGTKNKMVSTRYNNIFGYAIIFMSLHFVAYSLQDTETGMLSRNKIEEEHVILSRPEKIKLVIRDDILKSRKNVFFHTETLNVVPVGSKVAAKGGVIGGRKMARTVNEEHMNMKGDETTSKKVHSSSSENPSNGDHNPHTRSKKIYHDHHQIKGKMRPTFMVMNADYHVPRSHPPKNN